MTRPSTIRGAVLALGALLAVAGVAFAMPGPDRTDAEDEIAAASASAVATFGAEVESSASPEASPEAWFDDHGGLSDLSSADLEDLFGSAAGSPQASFDDHGGDDGFDDSDDAAEDHGDDSGHDGSDDGGHDDDSGHGSDDSGHDD